MATAYGEVHTGAEEAQWKALHTGAKWKPDVPEGNVDLDGLHATETAPQEEQS